ncbi:MAG: hypothetical protein JNN01_14355 [Opitutaceae bacterium]|nr:hypothetical protein [Opitutaceae bacterium]
MKLPSFVTAFLLVGSCSLQPVEAQTVIANDHVPSPTPIATDPKDTAPALMPGVTRLQLVRDIVNGFAPPEAPARVGVLVRERVHFTAPPDWPAPIQWTKNGEAIPGETGAQLILPSVTLADTGQYSIQANAPYPYIPTSVRLDVSILGRFGNFSARIKLAPGNDTQIVGYSISGKESKRLLIRAVGPTLRTFGVTQPASQPRFRIYTADGKELQIVRAAVVLPQRYWDDLFRQAGAFPLTGGERVYEAYDAFDLQPGTYTIHVSDDAHQGGEALVEIYEFDTYPPLLG